MKVSRRERYFVRLYQELFMSKNHPRYGFCSTHMDAYDENEYDCTDKLGEHLKCCHGKSAFATSQNDIV